MPKNQNFKAEKEAARAKFLVELLESHNIKADDIRLDFESQKVDILGAIDLMAFKNRKPFLIAQFLRNKPYLSEIALSRDILFEKMKDTDCVFGILLWRTKREIFKFENKKILKTKNF